MSREKHPRPDNFTRFMHRAGGGRERFRWLQWLYRTRPAEGSAAGPDAPASPEAKSRDDDAKKGR